jgi:hypothetical protein
MREAIEALAKQFEERPDAGTRNGNIADRLRSILDAHKEPEGLRVSDLLAWCKSRPGASWVAIIRDIEKAVSALSSPPQQSNPHWDKYVCINGHRNDHANLEPGGIKMCATPGCKAEAEVETSPPRQPQTEELVEKLAEYAHDTWKKWMKYQQEMGGSQFWLALPGELRERWIRQMNTPYEQLIESEKESDRTEARRILALIKGEGK